MSRHKWTACLLAIGLGMTIAPSRGSAQDGPVEGTILWPKIGRPVQVASAADDVAATAFVQPPAPPATPAPLPAPPAPKVDSPAPKADAPEPKEPPKVDASNPDASPFQSLTSSALGDTSFASGTPAMIGDFGAILIRRTFFVPTFKTITTTNTTIFNDGEDPPTTTTTTTTTKSLVKVPVTIYVPVAGHDGSGFKIADGATPIPTDRVFFTWNGFDDLRSRSGSFAGSSSSSSTPPVYTDFFTSSSSSTQVTTAPVKLNPMGDLNREIFGFEKTFLDGKASIEMRIPIYEGNGDFGSDFNGTHFGDATAILKYALLLDPEGLTFSAGLATTLPTGQAVDTDTGSFHGTLFQPFVGYLYKFGDAYVQGFSSIVVSTATQDPTLLFNDIGIGYRFYNGRPGDFVRSIDSVLEAHLTTPLDHRGENAEIIVTDVFSATAGLHFGVGQRSFLTFGVNGTMTGPRPYGIEGIVNLDIRF
jgi:hypothetical protein